MDSQNHNHEWQTEPRERWAIGLSAILFAGLEFVWFAQPVAGAPLMYVPSTAWAVAGVIVSWWLSRRCRVVAIITWVCIAVAHSEAVWSVPRVWLVSDPLSQHRTRVVSLNCNVGSPKAAREVAAFKPQLVLLQETPGASVVEQLTKEFWPNDGNCVTTAECSILAQGSLRLLGVGPNADWVLVEWDDRDGNGWLVASLRLAPPCARLDFWSREFRSEQAAAVERRVQSLRSLHDAIQQHRKPNRRVVIGGDFNMVSHDKTFDMLKSEAE